MAKLPVPRIKHTTASYIAAAKAVHGDAFLYHDIVYVSTNHKVTIHCTNPEHPSFQMAAKNFLLSSAMCPICRQEDREMTKEEFIAQAKARYGDRYGYDALPDRIMRSSLVPIHCTIHGDYEQRAFIHLEAVTYPCKKCMLQAKGKYGPRPKPRPSHNKHTTVDKIDEDLLKVARRSPVNSWGVPRHG